MSHNGTCAKYNKRMILARLRQETAALHQDVERVVDLVSPSLTLERYIDILRAFHAFFVPWEAALDAHCPASLAELWRGRQRSYRLEIDLEALESEPAASLAPMQIPELTEGRWLGSLYVIEGSTLGGQVISRHLEKHFGWTDGHRYSFFSGYGEDTGRQWQAVCAALESAPRQGNQIIDGAHLTFVHLRRCLHLLL